MQQQKSEQEHDKKLIISVLIIISLIVSIVNMSLINNQSWGSYIYGSVRLYPARTPGLGDYIATAHHEYAHYVWDKKLTREEKEHWKELIKRYGYESRYPFRFYMHADLRANEELAECYEHVIYGDCPCHEEKQEYIKQFIK